MIERLKTRDRDVVDRRVEALNGEIEIAIERQLHCLVEPEPYDRPGIGRRGGRPRRTTLTLNGALTARQAFGGDSDELLNARLRCLLSRCRRGEAAQRHRDNQNPDRSIACHRLHPLLAFILLTRTCG